MSYGAHMAAAAQALARAHTRLTDPVPEPGQRAVAAQARIGIYHSLEIQTVVLGAVYPACCRRPIGSRPNPSGTPTGNRSRPGWPSLCGKPLLAPAASSTACRDG